MTIKDQRIADAKRYVSNLNRIAEIKRQHKDIFEEIDQLERENKDILNRIHEFTHKVTTKLGKWLVTYITKRPINYSRMLAEHPEINADEYRDPTTSFKAITEA